MRKKALVVAALLFWCSPVFVLASSSRTLLDDEMRVFELVNQERARRGLRPVQWDARLSDMARMYSRQMADGGFFDHYDQHGQAVEDRARRARIRGWQKIGENLFYCGRTSQFVDFAVRGWLKSPAHRDNMFDPTWTASGIGIARAASGEIYVTEVFIAD